MNEFAPLAVDVGVTQADLFVSLQAGAQIIVSLMRLPRLQGATLDQLENWRLIGQGEGIQWPDLDEDVSVAALLSGGVSAPMLETVVATTAGIIERDGKHWMVDDRGAHVPLESVKPAHKLEDEIVRKVMGFAEPLSAQIERFMAHTMADLDSHDALLAQEYGVTRRGKKGNRTYMSYDGLMKVQVQVADRVTFGPELQQAKALIDELLTRWTESSVADLQVFVTSAFDVDREGKVSPAKLFGLRRFEITDPAWLNAMRAITDAVRPVGTKQYVRFYRRASVEASWVPVTIDLAKV